MTRIYFARAGADGPVKIGVTGGEPEDRIASLQTGCPAPIALLGALDGTAAHEQWLHRRFASLRLSGEWFTPDAALISFIDEMLLAGFTWPTILVPERNAQPADLSDWNGIIASCGGVVVIAQTGGLTVDAVHKWRKIGCQWQHWSHLIDLCGATPDELYRANLAVRGQDVERNAEPGNRQAVTQ